MSQVAIEDRLNQIQEIILSKQFLNSENLGGEVSFYIFDYEPEDELKVREYVDVLENSIQKKHKNIQVTNINLLHVLVDYLKSRNYLDKSIQLQQKKGDNSLFSALKGPLHVDNFTPYLVENYAIETSDIIFITGVGSVWPLLRAHNLLNSLHAKLGHKPLVLFYPGYFDLQTMKLFGKIPSNNYYRAFKLVP